MMQQMQPPRQTEKRTFDSDCSLYVSNLNKRTFENDLFKFVNSKGFKIANAKIIIDPNTKASRLFGYLNFYNKEEAERCLQALNNATLDERQISLSKIKDKDFDDQANLLVKNLPEDVD